MKRFAQQFKKQSNKVKLNAEEQFLLREKITTFMEYHPLPVIEGEVRTTVSLDTVFKAGRVSWKKMSMSFGMVAVAFVITLPAVAEYTVPGDMLYPVKIKINEEVRSTLARTPYEKVEWESKRIERRISEARVLAKAGLLTPEAEASVADAVTQHRSNASAEIAILRENNNNDEAALANMTLASIFEVQSAAFQIDNGNDVATVSSTATLAIAPRTLAGVIEGERVELARLSETGGISYGRLMAELEKQTTRAYERLESIKGAVSGAESSDINRRLQDISTRINEAKEKADESGSEELRKALNDTQKLIAFMNDIDVRSAIAVEKIVPITPNYEERLALFSPSFEEFKTKVEEIEQVTQQISSDIVKKEAFIELEKMQGYIKSAEEVTPKTIKEITAQLAAMNEKVVFVTEMLVNAGGNFEIISQSGSTATTSTSTTIKSPLN